MNLAVIPARGGSQRILRKNIREFCGQPIIAYSIEAALASGLFDRVIVSTDDEEIATVARAHDAGQFYWGRAQAYLEGVVAFSSASLPVILPRHLVQDIDTLEDWRRAELMYQACVCAPLQVSFSGFKRVPG